MFTIEPSRRRVRFIPARREHTEREPFPFDRRPSPHVGTCFDRSVGGRGSSPHAWNIREQLPFDRRFIPHVRGTCPSPGRYRRFVHPRTCGEHNCEPATAGPSPHVGNMRLQHCVDRFIPARAGTSYTLFGYGRGPFPHGGEHVGEPGCYGSFIPARAGNILPLLPRNLRTISRVSDLPTKKPLKLRRLQQLFPHQLCHFPARKTPT